MATTKLSTDVIDLSDNTEALLIPKGASSNLVDTTSTCNYPITAAALYQFENTPNATCGPNPSSTQYLTYVAGVPQLGASNKALYYVGGAENSGVGTEWLSSTAIVDSQQNLSISFWINFAAFGTGYQYLWTSYVTGDMGIFMDNTGSSTGYSQIRGNVYNGGSQYVYSQELVISTWYHVVLTRSTSAGMVLYINGTSVDTNSSTTQPAVYTAYNDSIGCYGYTPSGTRTEFKGSIDQFRAFQSVLTPAQVTQLYNESNITTTNGRPSSPTEGLMRENETTGKMEFYDGSLWQEITDTASTYSSGLIPSANFNTALYTGNGGADSVNVGFKSELTWIKGKDTTGKWNVWYDIVRGATNMIASNSNSAAVTYGSVTPTLTGFDIGSASAGDLNSNGETYVSWNWKAGGTPTVSNPFIINNVGYANASAASLNTGNSTPSGASINTQTGLSIIHVTTSAGSAYTVSHGLGIKPALTIWKRIDASEDWYVYLSDDLFNQGDYLVLNGTGSIANDTGAGAFTTTVMPQPTSGVKEYIAYTFASITGYSKIGFYVGNGSVTGPEIYTGFKPAWLLIRRYDSGDNWLVFDNKRNTSNPRNLALVPNNDAAESVGNLGQGFSFVSTGFQVASSDSGVNASRGKFIYMTFAE
jgi:hypothetical protein